MKETIKWLSIPTALVALFLIADIVLPSSQRDQATVTSKFVSEQGKGHSKAYNIKAKGRFEHNEQIDRTFYAKVNTGDQVDVGLSTFFMELREIDLVHDGKVVATSRGTDIYYMGLFGIIFLVPIFVSFIYQQYLSEKIVVYISLGIELIALFILCKVFLVFFGILSKV